MVKRLVLAAMLAILTVSLMGCQTMAGLGGDIQWSAQSTSDLLEGN